MMTSANRCLVVGMLAVANWAIFLPSAIAASTGGIRGDVVKDGSPFDDNYTWMRYSNVSGPVPLFLCHCNLPDCLDRTGAYSTCATRQGCFVETQPPLPELNEDGSPILPVATTAYPPEVDTHLNTMYGCLDLLPTSKTCDEILKSLEDPNSEFPTLEATSKTNKKTAYAYHCCGTHMCNEYVEASANVPYAQNALAAAFKNSMQVNAAVSNKVSQETSYLTLIPVYADEFSALFNIRNSNEDINSEKINTPAVAIVNETVSKVAQTDWLRAAESNATNRNPSVKIVSNRGNTMKHAEEDKMNVKKFMHNIFKRHDSLRAKALSPPVDDVSTTSVAPPQGDDTASEATENVVTTPPRRVEVIDSVHKFYHRSMDLEDSWRSGTPSTGNRDWVAIGVTLGVAVALIVGLIILVVAAIKKIKNTDVFDIYKGVCSNPGQPCACNGRRRHQPSSTNDSDTVRPPLPPPNKKRRHYRDTPGNTTYVFTPIPVPPSPPLVSGRY